MAKSAWSDLLIRLQRVYNRLAAAAPETGSANAWWGRKKHERENDELLMYLHQARHAEEHGLDEIVGTRPPSLGINPGPGGVSFGPGGTTFSVGPEGATVVGDWSGSLKLTYNPPALILVPVTNRNVVYNPPQTHLNSNVSGESPTQIAKRAIDYCDALIVEAEKRFI